MKNECNVARDLMPLVLDDAASEESRRLVREHLTECAPCAKYYDEMQHSLTRREHSGRDDQQAFGEITRQLKSKRFRQIARNVLIGVTIGLVLMFGGLEAWRQLTTYATVVVSDADYDLSLAQLADGRVVLSIKHFKSYNAVSIALDERDVNGKVVMNIVLKRPRILVGSQELPDPFPYYFSILTPEQMATLSQIQESEAEDSTVVWKKGEVIPAASQAMEAYFRLQAEIDALSYETEDGKWVLNYTPETQDLQSAMDAAGGTVPEWR